MQLLQIDVPKTGCKLFGLHFRLPIGPWIPGSLGMCVSTHPPGSANPLKTYQYGLFIVAVAAPEFGSWLPMTASWKGNTDPFIVPSLNNHGEQKELDRKSTRLNSSHITPSRMPSSA